MDEPQTKIEQHDLVVLASIMNMVTDLSKTIANHLAQGDEDRYLQAQHNTKMKHAVEGIHQKLSGLNNAFVGGDLDGHRQYHENAIEILRSRKEFWAKMTYELTRYGLFGFIVWLGYIAWKAFLVGPK